MIFYTYFDFMEHKPIHKTKLIQQKNVFMWHFIFMVHTPQLTSLQISYGYIYFSSHFQSRKAIIRRMTPLGPFFSEYFCGESCGEWGNSYYLFTPALVHENVLKKSLCCWQCVERPKDGQCLHLILPIIDRLQKQWIFIWDFSLKANDSKFDGSFIDKL